MTADWVRHLLGKHLLGERRPVRRFLAWPHALTATGAVLAGAALLQAGVSVSAASRHRAPAAGAVAVARTLAKAAPGAATASPDPVVLYLLPLCLLALATTVPLIFLPRAGAALAITVASALSLAAFGLVGMDGVTLGLMTAGGTVAQVIAVYRLGASRSGRYAALALALPFLVLALTGRGGLAGVLLSSAVPVAAGTGIAVRSRRMASRSDTARTALADSLVENMARGERARIARELHDVVAHHISMISVQAETARLTTADLPDPGAERFREIGDTARAGLTEMRRLLGVLRPDVTSSDIGERQPQPGLPQIASLIDAARVATGGQVRLIVSGPVTSYEPGVELSAYRITQEALTNARRHAPGAAVDVELRYEQDMLRLRVRDNGPGPGPGRADLDGAGPGGAAPDGSAPAGSAPAGSAPQAGHGLLGMRERAATVGGTLRTGEAPGGGFLVEAELPARRHDRAEAL
jgi:signal transduction histidine kinase